MFDTDERFDETLESERIYWSHHDVLIEEMKPVPLFTTESVISSLKPMFVLPFMRTGIHNTNQDWVSF